MAAIMRRVITDQLGTQLAWKGVRTGPNKKRPFKDLKLKKVIFGETFILLICCAEFINPFEQYLTLLSFFIWSCIGHSDWTVLKRYRA